MILHTCCRDHSPARTHSQIRSRRRPVNLPALSGQHGEHRILDIFLDFELVSVKDFKDIIGPSISSGRSTPLLEAAAVVVVEAESAGTRDASNRGVSCLRRVFTGAVHPL